MAHVTDQLNTALADRYRIERELGQGGMALVYLATDLKHDRKVALKILRPELAAVIGAERFLNEIKVTANLQHPHILPLHDSGEASSFLYYVMPYVEGETLRGKVDREKQLGLKEAVEITKQVAAALDYAHRQGVIHRDIKPENVLIHDGQALVADFGIALAVSHAGGSRLTETGLSIGTPHYMSPEQAMGDRELDARSDVYSLGAMLYEMLTGEPPYTGATAQAIVARVITEEPRPLTSQRRTVPGHVAAAVHQALSKLPADRFGSAAAFAAALENTGFTATTSASARPAGPSVRRPAVLALAAVAVVATALAAWGWFGRRPAPEPVTRERVTLGALGLLPFDVSVSTAISPDGRTVAWWDTTGGSPQIWTKDRDQRDPAPLPGTQGATGTVAFSPDGAWLTFSVANQLKKIPRRGGAPITLSDSCGNWGVFGSGAGRPVSGAKRRWDDAANPGRDGGRWRRIHAAGGRAGTAGGAGRGRPAELRGRERVARRY
jgi:predicted Ser/Thr protein kinase